MKAQPKKAQPKKAQPKKAQPKKAQPKNRSLKKQGPAMSPLAVRRLWNKLDLDGAAARGAWAPFAEYIAKTGSPDTAAAWTPLDAVIAEHQGKLLTALLDAGANPNLDRPLSCTPLTRAAQYGWLEGVETLLARGANPALRSPRHTPVAQLKLASIPLPTCEHIFRRLVDAGATVKGCLVSVCMADSEAPTPKELNARVFLLGALLDAGADPLQDLPYLGNRRDAYLHLIRLARGDESAHDVPVRKLVKILCDRAGLEEADVPRGETHQERHKRLAAERRRSDDERAREEAEEATWAAWLERSKKRLAKAKGKPKQVVAALEDYIAEGRALHRPGSELWDHISVSSPSLLEKAGYDEKQTKSALEVFETLMKG